MENPDISIIIPTFNRVEILKKTLDLLGVQTYPAKRFEVIVVDDGSTENIVSTIITPQSMYPYDLFYLRQQNAGPAVARNSGIKVARADIILLIGDDILPACNLIECHMVSHATYPGSAVLGMIEWSQEIEVTDFMKYIAPEGPQFRFLSIKDPQYCGFRRFYTSNISIGRKWFKDDLFDEEFPYAGFEDTELGYRLEQKGLRIRFNRDALGYHQHAITLDSYLMRMRLSGKAGAIFKIKHPEAASVALPLNLVLAKMIFYPLRAIGFIIKRLNIQLYWFFLIVSAYLEGMDEGMKRRKS